MHPRDSVPLRGPQITFLRNVFNQENTHTKLDVLTHNNYERTKGKILDQLPHY